MIRRCIAFLCIFAGFTSLINAQSITGTVSDENSKNALIGTNIIFKDNNKEIIVGSISDIEGNFSLDLRNQSLSDIENYWLEVSYVGFYTKKNLLSAENIEDLKNGKEINFQIQLEPDPTIIACPIIKIDYNYVNSNSYERIEIDELRNVNLLNQQDLYNSKPGLFMHSGALNTNRLTIRGIGSRSPFSTTKIRAYLNDIPLTNGIGETNLEDLNLMMVDEVEIWKGPTAPKFGAGLGGVIHYRTKNSDRQESNLQSKIGYGSFNTISVNQNFNYKEKDAIYSLNYDLLKSDGYRDNNDFIRHSITGFTQLDFGRYNTLTIFGNLVNLESQIPSALNIDDYQNNPSAAAGNWKSVEGFEDYQKLQLGITFQRRLNSNWTSSLTGFINTFQNDERRPFNVLSQFSTGYGSRFLFSRRIKNGSIELGTEFLIDDERWETYETLNEGQGSILSNNFEKRKYANAFAQIEKSWHPFKLIAGANFNYTTYDYDDFFKENGIDKSGEYSFDPVLSPFASFSYRSKSKEIYYLSLSHGFSAPTLEETLTPSGAINPDIDPETGWNLELGIRKEIMGVEIDASLYHLWAQNLLVSERISQDQTIGINAGKTNHPGLELEAKKIIEFRNKSLDKITLGSNYQYSPHIFHSFINNDMNFKDNFLPGNPKHKLNNYIHFTHFRWHANVSHSFVGKMFADDANSITVEDYQLVNFNLSYEFVKTKNWSIRFSGALNNILDEEYSSMIAVNPRSFGSALPRYLYPGLPRNYFSSLQIKYLLN